MTSEITTCACGVGGGNPFHSVIIDSMESKTTYYPCMGLLRDNRRLFRVGEANGRLGVHFWQAVVYAPSHFSRLGIRRIITNCVRHTNVLILRSDEPEYIGMNGLTYD
jgi:hypothetical protein